MNELVGDGSDRSDSCGLVSFMPSSEDPTSRLPSPRLHSCLLLERSSSRTFCQHLRPAHAGEEDRGRRNLIALSCCYDEEDSLVIALTQGAVMLLLHIVYCFCCLFLSHCLFITPQRGTALTGSRIWTYDASTCDFSF